MSLLVSHALVARIEQAEARSLAAIAATSLEDPFVEPLAGGVALYGGPGSPLNKVIALGQEPLTASHLDTLEARYFARGAAVQIELSTHADCAITNLLSERGYRLSGYENVLGRALDTLSPSEPAERMEVRRARADELDAWVGVLATGFSSLAADEQAAEHDSFDRSALEQVFGDMAKKPSLERWLAFDEGVLAGGAGMSVQDGVTQLFGAATLPAHRRRGVQTALLQARLAAGRASGSDLAVVTTQPGSASQSNVLRAGFALLYARAVWLRAPTP